jgi:MerR family redox-sensitive transcriptional activator SoxR
MNPMLNVEHMLKSSEARATVDPMTTNADIGAAPAPLSVSDIARESGVAASAVRFYEKYGVITAIRTPSNQRRFTDSAACRIKIAKLAQRVGLTVREIAEMFADLPPDPGPDDWGYVASALIEQAEARTAELRARLADMRSGTRLCEIVEQIDHSNPRPRS